MNREPQVAMPATPTTFLQILFIVVLLALADRLPAQALAFSNPSSVNIGDLDVPGNQVTVEALVYMQQNTPEGNIVSKHVNPLNVNYLLRPTSFELTAYRSGNTGPTHFLQMVNPFKMSLNRWYHIAGTYDGKRVKYYVDGCLVIDSAFTGNLYQNNYPAAIGNRSPCECEQFIGKIDEVRIWKVARTQQQIAANMLSLPDAADPALLAYYKFNGNFVNNQGNARWNGTTTGHPVFYAADATIQAFEVTGVQTASAACGNVANGELTVLTNRTDAVYSIDGIHYQPVNQFSALKTGNYTVYAKDPEGCLIKDNVTVGNDHQLVPLQVNASLCRQGNWFGHTAPGTYTDTLRAINGCDTLRTLYLTGSSQIVVLISQTICEGASYEGHNATGTYTDTLVAANGCDSIRKLQLTVLTAPHPDLGSNRAICAGDSIGLFPGKYNSYTWQDGSAADHFTVTQAGIYSVKVGNACGNKLQQVTITDGVCGLFFPNAFSPNGDGRNDAFRPVVANYVMSGFQWNIFNRAGQLVFETTTSHQGWDGRVNGQPQSAGVYVWTCTYNRNRKTVVRKGSFVLIR